MNDLRWHLSGGICPEKNGQYGVSLGNTVRTYVDVINFSLDTVRVFVLRVDRWHFPFPLAFAFHESVPYRILPHVLSL